MGTQQKRENFIGKIRRYFIAPPKLEDAFKQTCASWPFRLLAGLFSLASMLAAFLVFRNWLLNSQLTGPDFGGITATLAFVAMVFAFSWVACTGKLPYWLWRIWISLIKQS